jgi:uncharacterized protein with PIN domain
LSETEPGLLVDGTAGRLARWLRILGLDVEYAPTCEASAITRAARQSGRTVVTRNRAVAERMKGASLLLESEQLGRQLRQVVDRVGRARCAVFSRCSLCNARLEPVPRQAVRDRVPEYVYMTQEKFSVCPVCGRYYWRGTHWKHMLHEVDAILEGRHDG